MTEEISNKVEILRSEDLLNDPTLLTVVFNGEDHTLGNSLKHIINKMDGVEFCGYNVPHPLEDRILFRIQTKKGVDATDVLIEGLQQLKSVFASVRQKFAKSVKDYNR